MDLLKIFDLADITNILSGQYMEVISKYLLPAAIPVLIVALINCFLGHKVFKVLVGMTGLLVGAVLGVGIVSGIYTLTLNKLPGAMIMVIAAIVGAALIGFSSYKLYKGGAFCMGFVTGMILGVVIMKLMNKDEYIIAGVIGGLLMGLLAIDLYRHVVILLTSINGGLVSAACLAIIQKKDDPIFILKFGIVLAVLGILVQYILLYIGKKNAKEEEEEEEEFVQEERRNKKQIEPKKEKIASKAPTKKAKGKDKKNSQKAKKKKHEKKNHKYESEFFLVEIFSTIAQSIKDFVVKKFDLDTIEDEDYDEDYDDDYEDYEEIKLDDFKVKADAPKEKVRKDIVLSKPESINSTKPLPKEMQEEAFDLEDIELNLEKELDHSLEVEEDRELEDLIIKELYRNMD